MSRRGIPLREALREYSDPKLWKRFEKLKERGQFREFVEREYGSHGAIPAEYIGPFETVEERLVSAFLEKLKSGELIATGIDRKTPFSPALRIPAALLDGLRINFIESTASGDGFGFAGILVSPAEKVGTVAMKARLREWFRKKVAIGDQPAKFETMLEHARSELEVHVSWRMFRSVWVVQAPPDWKKHGRKTMRRIDTPS